MTDTARSKPYRGHFERLMDHVLEQRGIDLRSYRRPYLERRVWARVRSLEFRTLRQYVDYLEANPDEYAQLLDTLTINVTGFFRDKPVWDSLRRNALTPLFEEKRRRRSKTIRAWSAGCASGEEAYSLAMLFSDMNTGGEFTPSVTATDLDPEVLSAARSGTYDNARMKNIPPNYRLRFTQALNDSTFQVTPEIRRMVRFRQVDLFNGPPVKYVDLLVCRNVFIYFNRDQQAAVLDTFIDSLARGGYLVMGRSEKLSAQAATRLVPIDGRERIYQKVLERR